MLRTMPRRIVQDRIVCQNLSFDMEQSRTLTAKGLVDSEEKWGGRDDYKIKMRG